MDSWSGMYLDLTSSLRHGRYPSSGAFRTVVVVSRDHRFLGRPVCRVYMLGWSAQPFQVRVSPLLPIVAMSSDWARR